MCHYFRNILALAALSSLFSACGGTDAGNANSADTKAGKQKPPAANARPLPAEVVDTDLHLVEGGKFKLADKQGKVVLVNFWATWCGPCRAEMPALVRLQEQYRDQGFEVIGLNTDDESPEKIRPFAAEMKLNYPLVWSESKFETGLLNISKFPGIPQSFLIDRDGHLRSVFTGGSADTIRKLEENVTKLMQEPY